MARLFICYVMYTFVRWSILIEIKVLNVGTYRITHNDVLFKSKEVIVERVQTPNHNKLG